MKFLISSIMLFGMSMRLIAQGPVIDSTWFPATGAQFVGQSGFVIGVSAQNTGPDHVWDYSGLNDSSNVKVTTYLDPLTSAYPQWYPEANLASQEDSTFSFFKVSASGVDYYGGYTDLFSLILTDPAVTFQFPFSYGTVFSDSLSGTLEFSGVTFTRNGELTFEADGYGTLILPEGRVFDNVLRYRYTENTTDYHPTQGPYFISSTVNFLWISPSCPEPLLRISTFHQQNGIDEFESKSVFYSKGVFTGTIEIANEEPISVSVFPNPSDGMISILSERPFEVPVLYTVFDALGQLVFQSEASRPLTEVDLRHLPKGIYFLNMVTDGNKVNTRFSLF